MSWSVVEAKARLSEVLRKAGKQPQIIENRGEPVAVILSMSEYNALIRRADSIESTPMGRILEASRRLRETGDLESMDPPVRTDRQLPPIGE